MSTFTADVLLDVEVEYTCVYKGRPESGPTYSCGGEPAEPPEFEINRVMYNGTDILSSLSEEDLDQLREQAAEEYACDDGCEDRSDDDY